jgi:multiple sugar transport system permease protein
MAATEVAPARPAVSVRRRAARRAVGDGLMYLFVLLAGLTMFGPIVWMLLAAFKSQEEIITLPPVLLPSQWMWQNFLTVIEQSPIGRAYLNSMIVATTVTVAQVVTSTIGGYAFTKLRFPGRDALFIGLLTTMMIPAFLVQIPLFVMVNAIGWMNSYQALIVPSLFTAFGLFMMRQYMLNLPQEIVDAARIDGASELSIIFRIVLPLTREAAAALAIFAFIYHWDQLFWPLLVARQQHVYTVPLALLYMLGQYGNYEHLQMAGASLAILPPLIVFFLMQDKIVRGVTMTGLKG